MRAVRFAVPAEVAYDFTIAPRNRPRWQASLRRVDDVRGDDGVAGQTWTDVTVPGLRPRMRLDDAVRPMRWTESGRWHGVCAQLTLTFVPHDAGGCRVDVDVTLRGRGLARLAAWAAQRLAPLALRRDLARAAQLLAPRAPR